MSKEETITTDQRIKDLENSVNELLSVSLKQMKMFNDLHGNFINEVPKLKEKVALLEKQIQG